MRGAVRGESRAGLAVERGGDGGEGDDGEAQDGGERGGDDGEDEDGSEALRGGAEPSVARDVRDAQLANGAQLDVERGGELGRLVRVEEGDALDEKRAEEVAAEVGHHLLAEGTDALDVDEGDEGLDAVDAPEAREEPGELVGRALAHETLQELGAEEGGG